MIRGAMLVFIGACSFGVLSTIVKFAFVDGFNLGDITASQALLGVLALWLFHFISSYFSKNNAESSTDSATHNNSAWWKIYLAGFSSGLVSVLYYQCVKLLPASIAIILLMQYLWISVLIEYLVFGKKPSRIQLIAVALALIGTCFAGGLFADKLADFDQLGLIYGLSAALAYAIFLLANGRMGNNLPPLKKSALMITGACTLIFIVFPPTFLLDLNLVSRLWKWAIPLALFGTIIPPVLFAIGVPKAGITLSAIISAVELPVAIGMSYFVLNESVDQLQVLGIILMLLAIILPNLKPLVRNSKEKLQI